MKTIKELSDATGISKVSLYKLLKRDDIKGHVFKQGNASLIDETGEQLIKNHYNRERDVTVNEIVNASVNEFTSVESAEMIRLLQEQLREKDNQINALLNIVTNSQTLQVTQYMVDKREDKPKSFLERFFKKD